jgi:hypothetical protein
VLLGAIALLTALIGVNLMRSDTSFGDVLAQPIYYLIWGFVNFDAEAVGSVSPCVHTVPIVGCQFSVYNSYLISPTWNVFSAISPIYIDGGVVYVAIFFLIAGFALGHFEQSPSSSLNDYFYFVFNYFFLMAHNGYAFYSNTFFVSLGIIAIIKFLKMTSENNAPRNQDFSRLR